MTVKQAEQLQGGFMRLRLAQLVFRESIDAATEEICGGVLGQTQFFADGADFVRNSVKYRGIDYISVTLPLSGIEFALTTLRAVPAGDGGDMNNDAPAGFGHVFGRVFQHGAVIALNAVTRRAGRFHLHLFSL
jgi:hypothetical protein